MVGTTQRRVFLHIGAPKTGTTYLQEVLWRNKTALADAGVCYPGDRPEAHFQAVQDLRELTYHGHVEDAVRGAWDRVADEVRGWPGTSVISHEMLGAADQPAVERAMRSLTGVEVHIVLTARDLARQVPAVWQEDVKNCGLLTFTEFTRSLRGDDTVDPFFAGVFWGYQDLPVVLRTWGADLPPERVHVVTTSRGAAPEDLWHRFAGVVGVDPARCPTRVEVRNPSMGAVETNVVRLLNHLVGKEFEWPVYQRLVKSFLAVDVLAARPGIEPLRLPVEDRDWVAQWSKEAVEALRAAGYDMVGDLDNLLPVWPADEPRHPDQVSDAEVRDAAVYALAGALRRIEEERRAAEAAARPRPLDRYLRHLEDPKVRWMLDRYRDARARLTRR